MAWRWIDAPENAPVGFHGRAYRLQVRALDLGQPLLAEVLWLDPAPEIVRDQLCLGQGSAASGRATVEAVRVAALLTMAGLADALVTLPMAKSAAHLAGFDIPGHTEYLQELSGAPMTRMAFVSPRLNVVLHTVHQSLRSVVETLDANGVAETLAFSAEQFIRLTGKQDLRVALCALNPHAGEHGAFGEEERLLEDALVQAEAAFLDFTPRPGSPFFANGDPHQDSAKPHSVGQRGLEVVSTGGTEEARPAPVFFGPLPSDSVFQRASKGEFDLVVALYHDQGLIPVKLLEPTRAVNLTLGLPFIRTSPDHGTAFDKAGKWVGEAENFLEAAALAVRLAGRGRESLLTLLPRD
ncbi:PdxA family protein [Geothrix sp. PMB-07]|uniref:PdxA family dehydrogenase n=1 Tax=Geothrix sp. PMB-07 TaxID=3068640 RepID=UPI002741AFF4|nr:4-hydroxythreonine-4-phosphate dehydrogenase PdxA [Geothrix sp. PMB-07]WLT33506.1 4-hydroxythreonine-4-phosphate dehydrogenase PdxA [Geothrix sp. PMB-07]